MIRTTEREIEFVQPDDVIIHDGFEYRVSFVGEGHNFGVVRYWRVLFSDGSMGHYPYGTFVEVALSDEERREDALELLGDCEREESR